MSKIIDISAMITNELPVIKVSDDLVLTVNNRKNTILNMQAMLNQVENTSKKKDGESNEIAVMDKALSMLVGARSTEAINELDLPFPEYKSLFQVIIKTATGQEDDTPIA